jgi:hypothetical protein
MGEILKRLGHRKRSGGAYAVTTKLPNLRLEEKNPNNGRSNRLLKSVGLIAL